MLAVEQICPMACTLSVSWSIGAAWRLHTARTMVVRLDELCQGIQPTTASQVSTIDRKREAILAIGTLGGVG